MQSHPGHPCANCGQTLTGKYCAACGQPANTHKINLHYLWHDIQHGFFHFDNGLFFTVKQLLTRPGHTIREFLEGKRIRHFRPFSMVILLATVYALLYHFFHLDMENVVRINVTGNAQSRVGPDVKKINDWLTSHYALSTLLLLPLLALASWLAFFKKKGRFNYLEHLVITAFLTGQRLVVRIVVMPLVYAFKGTATAGIILEIVSLINVALFAWTYMQLFRESSRVVILLRCLLYGVLLFVGMIILAIIVAALAGKSTSGI